MQSYKNFLICQQTKRKKEHLPCMLSCDAPERFVIGKKKDVMGSSKT